MMKQKFALACSHLQIAGALCLFGGRCPTFCPPLLVGNIIRRNYIQNIWREVLYPYIYP